MQRYRDGDAASFFAVFDKISTFILANLLWIFCSLPIVTMPAATAGLFAVFAPWVQGKSTEPFAVFFGAFRQHWRKSTLIFVIDLIIVGLIVANFSIFGRMDESQTLTRLSQAMTLFLAIITLMINLYLWPLLVMFEMPLRKLLDTAVRLAFGHALWSLLLSVLAVLPVVLSLLLPAMFTLIGLFATCALLIDWGAWRMIRRYVVVAGTQSPGLTRM